MRGPYADLLNLDVPDATVVAQAVMDAHGYIVLRTEDIEWPNGTILPLCNNDDVFGNNDCQVAVVAKATYQDLINQCKWLWERFPVMRSLSLPVDSQNSYYVKAIAE